MEKINQEEAQKTAERMMSGKFDLNDMLSQMQQINNMGDIKGIMKMIPGLSKFQSKIDALASAVATAHKAPQLGI